MRKQFPGPVLAVWAAAAIACGSDGPERHFEPEPPPGFTALEISPAKLDLGTVPPGNTFQLRVWSYNQSGFPTERTYEATYASSAPAIAEVSDGRVTGASPGMAEITATLTLGGVTQSASTAVTVHARDYSDIAGVYDLSAVITSDGGWGYEGYRYTAVVTLQPEPGPSWVSGTYADLEFVAPGGDSEHIQDEGRVTGSFNSNGQPVIELHGDASWIGLSFTVGAVTPGFFNGTWGCCDGFSGTFTAERRRAR